MPGSPKSAVPMDIHTMIMGDAGSASLFDLMSWMSPAWPIGGFAFSGGLEWAVEEGLVVDRVSTLAWLDDLLGYGAVRNDAVLFTFAAHAAAARDKRRLETIAELAVASQTGFERRLESTAQGAAFRRIALATSGNRAFADLLVDIDDADLCYPVVAATLFSTRGIDLVASLVAWLHGVLANFVSAAQRLVPVGQTDGQLVLRDMRDRVMQTAAEVAALPGDGDPFAVIGSCTLVADIGCMAHETQYTRLFRT